jgi:hypothetical protein
MLLLTALRLWPSTGNFIFAGGSDILMTIVTSHFLTSITLAVSFFATVLIYKKKRRVLFTLLLTLIFLLWLLSGRMIALFPDGRLISGWFYIETNRTDICKTDIDCEKLFYYDTKFEKLSFWRLRIANSETNTTVFTGPFIWKNAIRLFVKEFPGQRL